MGECGGENREPDLCEATGQKTTGRRVIDVSNEKRAYVRHTYTSREFHDKD